MFPLKYGLHFLLHSNRISVMILISYFEPNLITRNLSIYKISKYYNPHFCYVPLWLTSGCSTRKKCSLHVKTTQISLDGTSTI
jgi:hypothetical protein